MEVVPFLIGGNWLNQMLRGFDVSFRKNFVKDLILSHTSYGECALKKISALKKSLENIGDNIIEVKIFRS